MNDTTRPTTALPGEVTRTTEVLRDLVSRVEPASLTPGEATQMWAGFNTMNRLIGAAQVRLAARVEEAGEWKAAGCRNAADGQDVGRLPAGRAGCAGHLQAT